jgi:hypothetical protein
MAIYEITSEKFEEFNPRRERNASMLMTEKSWFRDTAGNVIGVAFVDRVDKDWNWAILGRDERGEFRWIEGGVSLANQAQAETALKTKMLEIEKTGATEFPQGD